jgi:beta-phosphoglucomutase-like phosphatase (HAD superfamily)
MKAVIFDVDGTLFDSMPFWDDAGKLFLESVGIYAKEDLSHTLLSMTMKEGAEYLIKNYVPQMTIDEVLQGIIDVMNDAYRNKISLKKGAAQLLKRLKENNIPVVIATATDRTLLEAALDRLEIFDFIDKIFTCSECNTTKSVPDIYLNACDWLDTSPEETVVFADTLQAISTVSASNFITVAVKDESSIHHQVQIKEKADLFIEDFNQFNLEKYLGGKDENSINYCRQ